MAEHMLRLSHAIRCSAVAALAVRGVEGWDYHPISTRNPTSASTMRPR